MQATGGVVPEVVPEFVSKSLGYVCAGIDAASAQAGFAR